MIKFTKDKVIIRDLVSLKLDSSTPFLCLENEEERSYKIEIINCVSLGGGKARLLEKMMKPLTFWNRVKLAWKYIFTFNKLK